MRRATSDEAAIGGVWWGKELLEVKFCGIPFPQYKLSIKTSS